MIVVAGLGNPGIEYSCSRHNVGFIVADEFASVRKMTFVKDRYSLYSKRNNFTIVKPQTYMNLSGKAISRFTIDLNNLLVVCDDIYLPLGEIRIRKSGGDGGHNGLGSIISDFNSIDFCRMRIGIGQPCLPLSEADESKVYTSSSSLKHFVLENFSEEEFMVVKKTASFAVKLIDCFIEKGFQSMLNFYSKNKKSYSETIVSESKTVGGK